MAAPVVSGVAALMFQKHPEWTNDAVKWILLNNALQIKDDRQWRWCPDPRPGRGRGQRELVGQLHWHARAGQPRHSDQRAIGWAERRDDLPDLDLEHLDVEHLDVEHLDLEHLDLEHLDVEHQQLVDQCQSQQRTS